MACETGAGETALGAQHTTLKKMSGMSAWQRGMWVTNYSLHNPTNTERIRHFPPCARPALPLHRARWNRSESSADSGAFQSLLDDAGLELVVDCPPLPEPVYVDRAEEQA